MACPCLNNNPVYTPPQLFSGSSLNDDCGYDYQTLSRWKQILQCAKDTAKNESLNLKISDINIFLGNIISALNSNLCSYKQQLDQIQPYILTSINLNICQA